ncbi:3-ketoacyl-reductase [Terfezia boudieri ATCC MYA-4762]|uniref:Very-long-chain 3-oxoacyl-CoA reductase n=1 Tax=Terfezia boudieri ATCC MYA-4762 TaxID=1051890 RepID=A0A3N4LJC1_9PEZI|nr:3-ketoacyl-reductase [Terfezia boudieri ATCC MYA-4762]
MASILSGLVSKFQSTGCVGAVLALVGLGYLTTHVLCTVSTLLKTFVLGGKSLRSYGPKGSWALVTGASDGIGKEFALQLASKGSNILLVSRTESKLQVLAAEIESKYAGQGVRTKYLTMDFAKNMDSDYAKLKETVDGLDIAILVNNVGQSYDMPTPFLLTEKKVHDDIVTINVTGTLRVTQIVAPGMVSRKRGLILTMGSFGGLLPTPLLSVYSGSKAFLQHWSTALHEELRGKGVDVQFILSHMVVSNMSKLRKASLFAPTPHVFVKSALGKIGLGGVGSFAATTTPYWAHALLQWGIEKTVGVGSAFALKRNRKMHEDIRTRALRKREREKRVQ